MEIDPPSAGPPRRDLNGTIDNESYDLGVDDGEYEEYLQILYERYAGPRASLTEPATVPAQPTEVFDRSGNVVATPTLKTIVRNAITVDIAEPTGIV